MPTPSGVLVGLVVSIEPAERYSLLADQKTDSPVFGAAENHKRTQLRAEGPCHGSRSRRWMWMGSTHWLTDKRKAFVCSLELTTLVVEDKCGGRFLSWSVTSKDLSQVKINNGNLLKGSDVQTNCSILSPVAQELRQRLLRASAFAAPSICDMYM